MSRLSKTASAAIAALVVSGTAAVVPLLGPSATGVGGGSDAQPGVTAGRSGSAGPSAATSSGTAGASALAASGGLSGAAADEASGLPAPGVGASGVVGGRTTVLFLGDAPALRPRAGSARSFACRAATDLGWGCVVASRLSSGGVPASVRADVVVLVMTARDDARSIGAALDGLPAPLRAARTAVLAPIAVTAVRSVAAHLPGIRAAAAARGADVVDPVAQRWLTAATRSAWLTADGVQPTAAGVTHLADRLAQALAALRP